MHQYKAQQECAKLERNWNGGKQDKWNLILKNVLSLINHQLKDCIYCLIPQI